MSLKKLLIEEHSMYKMGNLVIRNIPHLKKYIKKYSTGTSHVGRDEFSFFYNYLERLDKLYHSGGKVYRLVIAPSKKHIKNKGVGGESNSWTANKDRLSDIRTNIMGDFLDGLFEPDDKELDFWHEDISRDEVDVFLITAKTPSRNIEPKESFLQCLSFPEEEEVRISDPNRLNVINIEKYES